MEESSQSFPDVIVHHGGGKGGDGGHGGGKGGEGGLKPPPWQSYETCMRKPVPEGAPLPPSSPVPQAEIEPSEPNAANAE